MFRWYDYGIKWTGVLTQTTGYAITGGNGQVMSADSRGPSQQYSIGTQESAVGPGNEDTQQEKYPAVDHDCPGAAHPEETDEWIEVTNRE